MCVSDRERERMREYDLRETNITLASIFYERVFYKIHTISVHRERASRRAYRMNLYVCYLQKRWYESLDVFSIRHRSFVR